MRRSAVFVVLLISANACGDEVPPEDPVDSGVVDAADSAAPDAVTSFAPAPPAAPALDGCPPGFTLTAAAADPEFTYCDALPAAGMPECADDAMWVPGEAGCIPIAPPCPADGFPDDIPAGAEVVYVRAGATGGDGSLALPFASIAAGVAAAASGGFVAIAPGQYIERPSISRPVTLRGGCLDVVVGGVIGSFSIRSADVLVERMSIREVSIEPSSADASATFRNIRFSGHRNNVVQMVSGGEVRIEDSRIDGVDFAFGQTGGSIFLKRVAITNLGSPLLYGQRLSFSAEQVAVSDVMPGRRFDVLIQADMASEVSFDRFVIVRADPVTIHILASSATFVDGAILLEPERAIRPNMLGLVGVQGAQLDVEGVRMRGMPNAAVVIGGGATEARVADSVFEETVYTAEGGLAEAIEATAGSSFVVERSLFAGMRGAALLASGSGTSMRLVDTRVLATGGTPAGEFGRAVQVQEGALVTAERVRIREAMDIAVMAAGGRFEGVDVEIANTVTQACTPTGCEPGGIGIGAYLDGYVSLDRFVLDDNELAGLQLALGGEADLVHGEVRGNLIGVNVQTDSFDVERLTMDVVYLDNGTNLDTDELPVPTPRL